MLRLPSWQIGSLPWQCSLGQGGSSVHP